ncbi:metallophosphatase family protein [Ramlibacter sp. XY19]|uniref:metallophosphoesterase family protein n=1 Tax=Ramlibacter paludis TaxID=2908000 RepID=UPI0023DAE54E|nr:metallophosphoesterase family protein [Ramlibacter paludis]MCG2595388.1 metallophosphatase family protein [Ramlibacter paludis]
MLRIGLISDTHGLLRPEVLDFLRGSDHILHAGDICTADVLEQLGALAPVTAVRGNNDRGGWADRLAASEIVRFEDVWVHMLHDVADLDLDPPGAGIQVLVCGHSHKPRIEQRQGVLHVNPGSAGPRRFQLPISAGELRIDGAGVSAYLVEF